MSLKTYTKSLASSSKLVVGLGSHDGSLNGTSEGNNAEKIELHGLDLLK